MTKNYRSNLCRFIEFLLLLGLAVLALTIAFFT